MQVKRFAATCVSGVLALSLGLGLVGCGNSGTDTGSEAKQESTAASSSSEQTVLGTQKDGSAEIKLKNGLGAAIKEFSFRTTGEKDYKDNLVPSGKTIAASEEVKFYVDSPKQDATYDIRVTKEDGSQVEFQAVPIAKIKSMTLMATDGKGYVDYVGTDGANGTTKAGSTDATAAQAEGAAAAGTAAAASNTQAGDQKQNQDQAADEAVDAVEDDSAGVSTEEVSYDEGSDYDPGYSYDYGGGGETYYEAPAAAAPAPEAPAPAAPAAPAQSADSCAPDVVLR